MKRALDLRAIQIVSDEDIERFERRRRERLEALRAEGYEPQGGWLIDPSFPMRNNVVKIKESA